MTSDASGRNVILIVLDSARADFFPGNTPNFDEFTARGARFSRAVAPAGWTLPSHASIFTGLSPTEHGIVALGRPGGSQENFRAALLKSKELRGTLIASQLRGRGIRTLSTTSSPWLWRASGLATGFEETDFFYFLHSEPPSTIKPGPTKVFRHLGNAARSVGLHLSWMRSGGDKGSARILDNIVRFAAKGTPFFAFANLIETHQPHYAPGGFGRPGVGSALWALKDVAFEPPLLRWLRIRAHNYGTHRISPRLMARWRDAYAAEIRYVDAWLARLIERLDAARVLDETTIILTSDHGEGFGEKGIVGHGLSLSQGSGHVPLGMWGGSVPQIEVTEPVGLTSLPATIRHLMFDEPEEASLLLESGSGFARMEIEDPTAVARPPKRAKRSPSGPGAAFYDGALKYVIDPFQGPALYDLDVDPTETTDLLRQRRPTTRQDREAQAWLDRVKVAE
jgi:arylsulfatase A-like enzyme